MEYGFRPVSDKSICAGMEGTCCNHTLEPVLMKALEREYNRRYLAVLRERLTPLSTAGRRLNSKYGV